MNKPIWYFSVMSSNRGDQAIRASIVDMIQTRINVPLAFFSCKYDLLDDKRIRQLNREASMLLIAGSGLYTNYPSESGWYFRCKTEDLQKITVPIVLFGVGSNNHLEKDRFGVLQAETLQSIKMINAQAVLTGVRDYRTLEILKSVGVDACLTPDPAMFLAPNSGNLLSEPTVGVSIAQHCSMLRHHRPLLLKLFAKVCGWLENSEFKTVFVAHDCLEHNLYADLKNKYPALSCYNKDNPRGMMKLYGQLKFSVGVRCHSNIMSFGAGIPFISLMYDRKHIEFLKLIGFPQLGIKINSHLTFKTVKEKLEFLCSNLPVIKTKFKQRKCELQKMEDNFIDKLVKIVNSNN